MSWILLVGCVTPDVPAGDTSAVPPLDLPEAAPAWSAEDAAAAWSDALAGGWPSTAEAIDAYLSLLSHGDAECPGDAENLDDSVVLGCTSAEGYLFSGISTYDAGDGYRHLHADMRLATPDGDELLVGGTAWEQWEAGQVADAWEGTWVWEGSEGPLGGGVSGRVVTTFTDGEDGSTVVLDGALSFAGLSFEATDLAIDGGVATGEIALRDPSVGWHVVSLDGASCGAWAWEGEDEGEACLDFAPLLDVAAERLADHVEQAP